MVIALPYMEMKCGCHDGGDGKEAREVWWCVVVDGARSWVGGAEEDMAAKDQSRCGLWGPFNSRPIQFGTGSQQAGVGWGEIPALKPCTIARKRALRAETFWPH